MAKQLHLVHRKSSVAGKVPSASTINYGEIAVNYNDAEPTLFIRTNEDRIESFVPTSKFEDIVGDGFESGKTITEVIEEDELVVAAAVNDLNDKLAGKENASNKVTSLSAQSTNTEYPGAKCVYDAINPPIVTTQPVGGFEPNVVYDLGTLTGSVTFALAAGVTGRVNTYHWTFDTGLTAPTIIWPSGIIWPDGFTTSVDASKHYEVLVRNGYASMLSYSLS